MMDERNLMDDIDLFVNDAPTVVLSQQKKSNSSVSSLKTPISSASADLRDVFVFDSNQKHDLLSPTNVPTDNLLGFTEWNSSALGKTSPFVSNGLAVEKTDSENDNTENWPELPTVSVENYTTVRSSRSSNSSCGDNHRRESLDKLINHAPLLPSRSSLPPVADKLHYHQQRHSSVGGAVLPPRLNRNPMKNGKLPNGVVSYSKAGHHDTTSRRHSQHTDETEYSYRIQNDIQIRSDRDFDIETEPNYEIDDDDDEDHVDEDEVFLGGYRNCDSSKPLINAHGVYKKKVRFLDGSRDDESMMHVGSLRGGDSMILKKGRTCRYALIRFGYLLAANAALAAIVCSIIYLPPLFKSSRRQQQQNSPDAANTNTVTQCARITVTYDQVYSFQSTNLYPTSELKLFNLTNDRRLSVVFGYGTSSNGISCDTNINCQRRGGVSAYDVTSNKILWQIDTLDEILGVNCQEDVNRDGVVDCAIGGRSGIMKLLNGRDGSTLWEFGDLAGPNRDILSPQWVSDSDGDGIAEILITINTEIRDKVEMILYMLNGKTGQPVSQSGSIINIVSMKAENPAFIWKHGDIGLEEVVWTSGTLKINGGLNLFSLRALNEGKLEQYKSLYSNSSVLSPAIYADLNEDGTKDVIFCTLSGEVRVYSGVVPDHNLLWSYRRPHSQCTNVLLLGSFENDTCPDIVVTFNVGDGFPNYNFFETLLLSGKTGALIQRIFTSPLPVPPVSLALKTTGLGNDLLFGFRFSCTSGLSGDRLNAGFSSISAPQSLHDLASVDFCSQLYDSKRSYELIASRKSFNTTLFSSLSGPSKLFAKPQPLIDWAAKNRIDVESLLLQFGQIILLNVSPDGSSASLLIPSFWTSALDNFVFPKECFTDQRDYLSGMTLPEKCRKFIDRREKRKKLDYIGGDTPSYMQGFTNLHKITVSCHCDDKQLANSKSCSRFVPPN